MKQIIVGENLPPSLVRVFEMAGIPAKHIYELGRGGQSDSALWTEAIVIGAAVATKDSDFLDLAAIKKTGQVILFKVGNMRISEVLRFAARHVDMIAEFLASSDEVLVLRP